MQLLCEKKTTAGNSTFFMTPELKTRCRHNLNKLLMIHTGLPSKMELVFIYIANWISVQYLTISEEHKSNAQSIQ